MRFTGVFNRDGGTFRTIDMMAFSAHAEEVFAAAGHVLDCRVVPGAALAGELARVARDVDTDVLLAGGGDGTISAAAAACFETGKPLAVLPAGTMNLFARTLKVPPDLEEALEAIAGGGLVAVDIATANGAPFVHQYSVGLHARLVRIREEMPYGNRWEKMLANVRAVAGAVSKRLRFQVEIVSSSGSEVRIASGISVSNNLLGEGHVPHADVVDGGVLGVYLAKPMSVGEALRLLMLMMLGRWKGHPRVSETEVSEVALTFPKRKRSARALIDGELVPLPARVELKIHPGALKAFAPRALVEEVAARKRGPVREAERDPNAMA